MGSITEMIEYLNVKKHPTKTEREFYYTHFNIEEPEKMVRREYRKALKLSDIEEEIEVE